MKNEILNLTKRLITIESTKENLTNFEKVLAEAVKELKGFRSKRFVQNQTPSSIYFNHTTLPSRFKIILNAHLDVVPANKSQFHPRIVGDKLFGRGAMDMKGAAAVEILVFKELANKVNYPLGLQLVTDEEVGGFDGTKHQIEKGIKADFVVAGEPTDFGVNNKAKGIVWAKIVAKGISAHGAYPWNGVNSVKVLNDVLVKIWNTFPIPNKEVWKTTVNIGRVLTTNETFNKVPDYSEAWLDIRYIPEDVNKIIPFLKSLLPKNVNLDLILKEPSQITDENNKFVELLRNSTKKVLGKIAPIIVKHGGSDIRHFNTVGCDGVTFGPVGFGLHTDNEWVSIKSLDKYYQILKHFLLSI